MKNIKKTSLMVLMLVGLLVNAQEQSELNCSSFTLHEDTVIFKCDGGAGLSLKFLDSKNVRFWFSPDGSFNRKNESFAVVNEDFDPTFKIEVEESTSEFEIFTNDLRIKVYKRPLKVRVYDKYQRLVMGDMDDQAYVVNGTQIETRKVLRDDEQFFGLGEKTGPLNRRGHSYKMWNSDQPCYSDSEDPLYKSIPFFISTKNYGIYFDNTYKTEFDFGEHSEEYFSFSTPDGPFTYYFMFGKGPKEVIKSYTKLTGQPIMPPEWAFGWAQSRGLLTNEKLTRKIADEYRSRNIPIDIIYQDIGWVDGLQTFDWKKENYENPKKMLSDLKKKGYKVIVSQDPVVSQSSTKQWTEADKNGFFALDDRNGKTYDMPWPWGGNAGVVDFTNPEVADWWGELQQKPIDDGVSGFWTDMGEPAWSNEEEKDRLHMKHYLGMHDEIHNVYGLAWNKAVTDQFEKHNPDTRIFQMTRASFAGMQRYTFGWSGDSGNGMEVSDGWKNLANQIPTGLSAGMGLIPFWTTDISGYCGDIVDYEEFSELYVRWLQFGIFNPLSRAHHEGNNAVEPWLFGDQAEKIAKKYIAFKYQLHPYIYTYARTAYDTGIPIMRALFLEYPRDEKTYGIDDQFLFGKEFVVAPVVKEGQQKRKIYLPKGRWINYNNPQESFSGEQFIETEAPLDLIPLFVKAGAIIPKMPIMPYIGAMKNTPMIVEVFPSDKVSSFVLYEDDGVTNAYKQGEFMKTNIEAYTDQSSINVVVHKPEISNYDHREKRNFWFEIHQDFSPEKVLVNGKEIQNKALPILQKDWNSEFKEMGYSYDNNQKKLFVKFPDTKNKIDIKIIK